MGALRRITGWGTLPLRCLATNTNEPIYLFSATSRTVFIQASCESRLSVYLGTYLYSCSQNRPSAAARQATEKESFTAEKLDGYHRDVHMNDRNHVSSAPLIGGG